MPRQEQVLTVFVASPADVAEERARLEDIIRELNITWSRQLGVRLELVRWETHAYPGISVDAQAVINEQIDDDYDIFVGIMWCRYGTATGRAGSGTVEEFDRAKARHDRDPSSVKLMVYFKDEPVPPSKLDPEQLAKVSEFRSSLGEDGGLYWMYQGIDAFEQFLRLHLTRQMQAWVRNAGNPTDVDEAEPVSPSHTIAEDDDDDIGLFELVDTFEEAFEELAHITDRIVAAIDDVGERTHTRTSELEALPRDAQGIPSRKDAKRVLAKAASDLDEFTARIDVEVPLFRDRINSGLNAFIRSVAVAPEMLKDNSDELTEALDMVQSLSQTMGSTFDSTAEFRESVANLPRMTLPLNRAKRAAVNVIDSLLRELANGEALLREAETSILTLLAESQI